LRECVDTYVEHDLNSIFLRPLNPYGIAEENKRSIGYNTGEYIQAYKEALDYIIKLNIEGTFIREEYACIFLQKILTPFPNGFVDIQSPAGIGIECAVYDSNGEVYPSDESRMLARKGDKTFLLGSVFANNYLDIFSGEKLRNLIEDSIVESNPLCLGCPMIPYCGIDPVRKYQESKLQEKLSSCYKYKEILNLLFSYLRENDSAKAVFWSWIRNVPYKEILI
jgi:radical SAM protein with 4Fe4S-binding SPASM domain